jgi:chromosome condensin MukBEF MukE localization factor
VNSFRSFRLSSKSVGGRCAWKNSSQLDMVLEVLLVILKLENENLKKLKIFRSKTVYDSVCVMQQKFM